jgi:hypothetical protein
MKTAVEMTGHGRGGKPKTGFLRAHSPWKSLRDSHIPTAATKHGKVENQKQVSHFPTAYCFPFTTKFRKEAWRRSFAPSPGSLFD